MPGIDLRSMLERSGRMGRHEERMRERASPCRSGRDQTLQLPRLLLRTWNPGSKDILQPMQRLAIALPCESRARE